MKRIAVDLAKSVYQVAESVRSGHVVQRKRLNREAFRRHIQEQAEPVEWVMEACWSARRPDVTGPAADEHGNQARRAIGGISSRCFISIYGRSTNWLRLLALIASASRCMGIYAPRI